MKSFLLKTPASFKFWPAVYSHGWCDLRPFAIDKEAEHLDTVLRLSDASLCAVRLREGKNGIRIQVLAPGSPAISQHVETKAIIAQMFRLAEPMEEFYARARREPDFRWMAKSGGGRLLRCQTVFEDVVKMICTTNCSWALTKIITDKLSTLLGAKVSDRMYSFPEPAAIAAQTESFMRKEIRCGYRAPYLLELAESVASGQRQLEHWRAWQGTTEELFKEMRSVKGVGEYAAGALMKLVGRYEYLGLDSWCRSKFYELHARGKVVSDARIEKYYAPFGKWRGLFLWMDVTHHWFTQKFPF
jgi:N-glycosylase/DNA lyase